MTTGDLLTRLQHLPAHGASSHPTGVTVSYLAGYLCLLAAVTRIGRDPDHRRREDVTDAAIITLGSLAASWYFLMAAHAGDSGLTSGGRVVLLSYPVLDIALVLLVLRYLVLGAPPRPFRRMLAAGLLLIAVADFAEGVTTLHGGSPRVAIAGFLVAYVLIGASALHPSVAEGTVREPKPVPNVYRREPSGGGRIPVIAFAASSRRPSCSSPAASMQAPTSRCCPRCAWPCSH
jgi:hypothetical protein